MFRANCKLSVGQLSDRIVPILGQAREHTKRLRLRCIELNIIYKAKVEKLNKEERTQNTAAVKLYLLLLHLSLINICESRYWNTMTNWNYIFAIFMHGRYISLFAGVILAYILLLFP